jgi:hypothetical protein
MMFIFMLESHFLETALQSLKVEVCFNTAQDACLSCAPY